MTGPDGMREAARPRSPRPQDGPPPATGGNPSQEIATLLRDMIISGHFPARARLREADLARTFGVSRTPVREALIAMEREGLVLYSLNRGFTVRQFGADDLAAAFEMRALLEAHACRTTAERGLSAHVERQMLETINSTDELLKPGTALDDDQRRAWQRNNTIYHHLLLSQIPNEFFRRSVEIVQKIPLVQHAFSFHTDVNLLVLYNKQHRDILNAIVHRQGGRAEHLMREHIGQACDWLQQRLAGSAAAEP